MDHEEQPDIEEFLDLCDIFKSVSSDLNKFNIVAYKDSTYDLQPHDQAIYALHIRHVMDFCRVLSTVIARSGPLKQSPLPMPPSAAEAHPRTMTMPQFQQQPIHQGHSQAAQFSPERGGSSSNGPPRMGQLYYAGIDFAAQSELDINIKKGDRIQMEMIMDDGEMALGSNTETGATGTFPVKCITTGSIVPEGGPRLDASGAAVGIGGAVGGSDENAIPEIRNVPKSADWSPVPVPNPLGRKVGRHVASRTYQSGSVLEASLERGDEVEVMFWEDNEIAVGVHIPTQTEGLFRGSMLVFIGNRAAEAQDSNSPQSPRLHQSFSASDPYQQDSEGPSDENGRKSILAAVVAFQQNDADQYKNYLDAIDRRNTQPQTPPMRMMGGSSHGMADFTPPPRGSSAVKQAHLPPQEMSAEEKKRLQGAKHVLAELHATEEGYMKLLRIFMDFVVEPMRQEKILSTVDIDRSFKYLPPIYELSGKVETHLREANESGTGDPTPVVDLFLRNIQHEEWIVYENYIKNYQPAKQIIQKMIARQDAKGEQFRQFLRRIENDPNCERKNLDDFMMLPIQRITRYWLLLERLKKFMEAGSVGYESIEVAERYMKEVGNTLQGVQMREEEMRKMFEIVNTVDHCPSSILSYSKRRFVAEYECSDLVGVALGFGLSANMPGAEGWPGISNMVTPGPGTRRMFLFTDCILIAAYRTGRKSASAAKKLELVQRFELNRVSADERRDEMEADVDVVLRLRVSTGIMGQPDEILAFRMNNVASRKAMEKAIRSAHTPQQR